MLLNLLTLDYSSTGQPNLVNVCMHHAYSAQAIIRRARLQLLLPPYLLHVPA